MIVVFRNDDLSGCSDDAHERRVAAIFERYRIPQTLGVVPMYAADSPHDPRGTTHKSLETNPDIVAFLRTYVQDSGSEIALHGYTHRTNRHSHPRRREYSEFTGFSLEEQRDRIAKGTQLLAHSFGRTPRTFIPPWNRLDANTLRACAENGYQIVSAGPFAPTANDIISLGVDCDLERLPTVITAAGKCGQRAFVRVMYHSRTIRTTEDFAALERAVRVTAESPFCKALTIGEVVDRYPDEVRQLNQAARNIVPQDQVRSSLRARATVYRRLLQWLHIDTGLEDAYKRALEAYDEARYEVAARLSPEIDRLCRHVVMGGRSTAGILGATGTLLITSSLSSLGAGPGPARLCGYGLIVLAAMGCGGGAWWYATAPDTRDEIRTTVRLMLLGGSVGAGLWELANYWGL